MILELQERIKQILVSLNNGLIEREEIMNLTFLSSIAGESIFLLGPPGVAKSLIARRLKFAFKDAKSFEYLMHRFSTPDEVFGPISVSKLKNEDKLERSTEYYLPGSNVAFLDEIWKAGPSIQNTLLTILNEKIYRNGEQQFPVDLFAIIAASNELPEENQGLDALWDRFLIRMHVLGIKTRENFEKMILEIKNLYSDNLSDEIKITKAEYKKWQTKIDNIDVPKEVLELIHHIRIKIEEYNENISEEEKPLYISDRRWKKIIKIIKTSAFLNGRKKVDLMDCFLVPYMIWDNPEQIDNINRLVKDCIYLQGYTLVINFSNIQDEINAIEKEVEKETKYAKINKITEPKVYMKSLYMIDGLNYSYIDKDIFDSMQLGVQFKIIAYRDDTRTKQTNYLMIKQSDTQLEISNIKYNLMMTDKKETVTYTKKPHVLLIKAWDKKINDIKSKIGYQNKKIDDYVKTDLKDLAKNLFVQASKAEIVLNKIEELKVKLNQFTIKCDEIKHYYSKIEDSDEELLE